MFKFWLIAKSDIPDQMDDPYEYVVQVLHPMDAGIAYGPGTGLFGRFFYEFGIPFRLGIEIAFMIGIIWALDALINRPDRSYLACGLFLFAIFNPAPNELFSHFYSDQIWMIETLMGAAYLVFALRDSVPAKGVPLACSAILLGFSTITRSCFAVLVLCLVFFTLAAFLLIWSRRGRTGLRKAVSPFLIAMSALILGISSIYYATCFYNWHRHHYFGISALDCSEYRTFFLSLQSVGEPTGAPHFPVDEDRRTLIAEAGPQASALMDQLNRCALFKGVGYQTYGRYDIPTGWFHLALYAVNDSDTDRAFVRFAAIESEIHDAGEEGKFKTRSVPPLPDSRLNVVLPLLPAAFDAALAKVVNEPPPYPSGWSPQKLSYENPEFSGALTRRAVSDSPTRYSIWRALHAIYAPLYTKAMVCILFVLVIAFLIFLALYWSPTWPDSLALLAQQIYALLFIALVFWYALFDASGVPVVTRYVIFQNVLLPILIAYYVRAFATQFAEGRFHRR